MLCVRGLCRKFKPRRKHNEGQDHTEEEDVGYEILISAIGVGHGSIRSSRMQYKKERRISNR